MVNPVRVIALLWSTLVAAAGVAQVPTAEWTQAYGGVGFDDVTAVVYLASGDFVIVGNTASPGPSAGTAGNLTEDPPVGGPFGEGPDLLAVRFDAAGTLVWERRIGGVAVPTGRTAFPPASYDAGAGIAVDAQGDLVIAATSNSAPDAANADAKQAPLIGDSDIWVIKLAPDGTTIWENTFGGIGQELADGIAVLPNGNYVATGTQQPDPKQDFDQSATEDLYAAVIAPDGTLVNERTYGGNRYDRTWSTLGLSDGTVIIGGASASAANPAMGKTLGTYGNSDIFLVHLDAQGDFLRSYQFGSDYTEQPTALAEDAMGNVFVASESKFTGNNVAPEEGAPTRDVSVYGSLGPPAEPDVYYLNFTPGAAPTVNYEGLYGGAAFDRALAAIGLPNGCVAFSGDTRSTNRAEADAASGSVEASDAWLVQLDPTGIVVNDASRGGAAGEYVSALANGGDGALLLAGVSASGPFEWNADGAFIGPIPNANTIFLAQLACGVACDLGPPRTICKGEVLELSNLLDAPPYSGCREWVWTDGSGAVLGTDPTLTYEATADATVTLTTTGPFGCERSASLALSVVSAVQIAVDAQTDPACGVDDGELIVSAPGAGEVTLTRTGSPFTATVSDETATFSNLAVGNYTLTATSASGGCGDTVAVTLLTEGLDPDFAFAVAERNLCLGEDLELATDLSGFATYRVLAPDGTEICSDASGGCGDATFTPTVVANSETLILEATTTAGCDVAFGLTFFVSERAEIALTAVEQPTCDALGSLAGTFSGGAEIRLNGADGQGGGAFSYADLAAGSYVLTVAAANERCSARETIDLVQGSDLAIDTVPDQEACIGDDLTVPAPAGVQSPDVDSWTWLDLDTQQPICDCSDLDIPTSAATSRTLALQATTDDGCVYTDTFTVAVYATPTLTLAPRPESCGGANDGVIALQTTDAFVVTVDGVEFPVDTALRGFGPGQYEVVAASPLARCNATEEAVIGAGQTFAVDLGEDRELVAGEAVTIEATVTGIADYTLSWSGIPDSACGDCPMQTFIALGDFSLIASAESAEGCVFSDTIFIAARQDRRVFFPNAFSPNGDGQNDRFAPFLTPFVEQAGPLRIFDRWGNLVFLLDDPSADGDLRQQGWDGLFDGREAAIGVYTYTLPVTYVTGETRVFRGDVTLLR